MWYDLFIYFAPWVTWLIHIGRITYSYMMMTYFPHILVVHMCDMTHSYVRHDSFIRVTWLIHICRITHSYIYTSLTLLSFICVTWLIHMCDMPHSYVRHDLFINVASLIHMSRTSLTHFTFICVIWLIHMRDMTHSYVWHDSSIRDIIRSYVAWHLDLRTCHIWI